MTNQGQWEKRVRQRSHPSPGDNGQTLGVSHHLCTHALLDVLHKLEKQALNRASEVARMQGGSRNNLSNHLALGLH